VTKSETRSCRDSRRQSAINRSKRAVEDKLRPPDELV